MKCPTYKLKDLVGKTFELDVGSSALSYHKVIDINRIYRKIKSVNNYGRESITDVDGFAFMAGIIIEED